MSEQHAPDRAEMIAWCEQMAEAHEAQITDKGRDFIGDLLGIGYGIQARRFRAIAAKLREDGNG